MSLDERQLRQLFSSGRRLMYQKDDVIIRTSDTPSGVYYIVSGAVKVYCLCKDGDPNIIMTLSAGQIFPLAWAVGGAPRYIGFSALGVTELWRVPRESFLQDLWSDSDQMYAVLQMLARHFSWLACEMDNLQYRSAREKIVFRLLFLASHFGQVDGNTAYIDVRVTNDYLARSTNMTRETASREVSRLNRKQLVKTVNGRLIIPDLPRLSKEISQRFNPAALSLD